MSRDGSGTYNLPPGNPVVTETVISSTTHNTTMADVATALTQSISKDGQTTYTSNQSMGGFKHTQVADATARNQYATAAQVQDGTLTTIGSVSGTDTITGTVSPAISAYVVGVGYTLIPAFNNAGAVTLNLNGLGARPVLKFSGVPLVAGDLLVGIPAVLNYNGTSFYLENPQLPQGDVARTSQPNNFTSNNTFSVIGTSVAPSVSLTSALPILGMSNPAAVANNRSWLQLVQTDGAWVLRCDSDDHSSFSYPIAARRSGSTVTNLDFSATTITVNGVNVSDYARLSQTNQFTAVGNGPTAPVRVWSAIPSISWGEADASTDNKWWDFAAEGGAFAGRAINDSGSGASNWVQVNRSGATIASVALSATVVTVNGANVRDAGVLFNTGALQNSVVQQSNVTQHQSALSINASQVTVQPSGLVSSVSVDTSHTGRIYIVDNASPMTLTVTANCLGADGKMSCYIRRNTGSVTFVASGVTLRSPGGGTAITVQHGKVALIQMTSTDFELAGNV